MLTTMRFADEIRPATQLDLPNGVGATREKKLALQLIDTLAADWEPKKNRDATARCYGPRSSRRSRARRS
jgi:non-homologous end joining protein Ku